MTSSGIIKLSQTAATCQSINNSIPDFPFVQLYPGEDKLYVFYPMRRSDFYASKIIFHFPFFFVKLK